MALHLLILVLVLGPTDSQWLSFSRGPNSDKLWMPNMPSPRGGPRTHGRFQSPAPTLRPPVPPPASPANRPRAMPYNQGGSSQPTNNGGQYDIQQRGNMNGQGPQPPLTRNFAGQTQNFLNGRNQNNNGKVPLPPQPRAPVPTAQQMSQTWRNNAPAQQQQPQQQQQQQQQQGIRDQRTEASSTYQVVTNAQGNRGFNWQGPQILNTNQNQNNNQSRGNQI